VGGNPTFQSLKDFSLDLYRYREPTPILKVIASLSFVFFCGPGFIIYLITLDTLKKIKNKMAA
jgi:hypothetical protein